MNFTYTISGIIFNLGIQLGTEKNDLWKIKTIVLF